MPGQDNKIVNYETMGKGLRRRIIPSSGHGPYVCVCVCRPSFRLVSVHKDADVLSAWFCPFNVISATLQRDISVGSACVSGNLTKCQLITIWPDSWLCGNFLLAPTTLTTQVINGLYTHTHKCIFGYIAQLPWNLIELKTRRFEFFYADANSKIIWYFQLKFSMAFENVFWFSTGTGRTIIAL